MLVVVVSAAGAIIPLHNKIVKMQSPRRKVSHTTDEKQIQRCCDEVSKGLEEVIDNNHLPEGLKETLVKPAVEEAKIYAMSKLPNDGSSSNKCI